MAQKSSSDLLPFTLALLALLLVPAAKSDTVTVSWASPTPADRSSFSAEPGGKVSFTLSATSTVVDGVAHIAPLGPLPKGAALDSKDGTTAHATFTWRPTRAGDFSVQFTATVAGAVDAAPTMTYIVHVGAKVAKVSYPRSTT